MNTRMETVGPFLSLCVVGLAVSTFLTWFICSYSIPKEMEWNEQRLADFHYAELNRKETP